MSRTEVRIERVVAALEPPAAQTTRARLQRMRADCGCREGALLMVTATIATVLYLALDAQPRSTWAIMVILAGVLFSGAAVGKAIGLMVARVRLLLALNRLERRAH